MTAPSIQVLLEALPDLLDGVDVDRVAADGLRVVAAWDVRLDDLRDAARPAWQQHDAVGDVDGLLDRVGDEDEGLALLLDEFQQVFLELAAGLLVAAREGQMGRASWWGRG